MTTPNNKEEKGMECLKCTALGRGKTPIVKKIRIADFPQTYQCKACGDVWSISPTPDSIKNCKLHEAIGYGACVCGWWRMPPANVRNNSEIPNSSDSIEKCEACDAQGSFGIIPEESHTCDKVIPTDSWENTKRK